MRAVRRVLRTGVLVAVLGSIVVTSGAIAQGGERGGERAAVDCDALGRRLRAAVEAGELTPEEARERYEAAYGEHDSKRKWMDLWEDVLVEVAAEQLGMTSRALWGELKAGTTIAGLAEAQGVDPQAIYDAYLVDLAARLDALVAPGRITQEEAEGLLARIESRGWVTASTRAPG